MSTYERRRRKKSSTRRRVIWAIVFGALFFGEYPDYVAVIGLVIVLTAGLANVMTEKLKIVWKPRIFFWRTGL